VAWSVLAGTPASGIGSVTPTLPSHQAGDLLVLLIECNNTDTPGLTTANGFTRLPSAAPQVSNTASLPTQADCYIHLCASSSESAPVVADSGDHTNAVVFRIRGNYAAGTETDAISGTPTGSALGTASTAVSIPGCTSLHDGCAVFYFASNGRDVASTAAYSGWTNASLAGVTEVIDYLDSSGNGGGFGGAWGTQTTQGATGTMTAAALGVATGQAMICFAVRPDPGVSTATGASTSSGSATEIVKDTATGASTSSGSATDIDADVATGASTSSGSAKTIDTDTAVGASTSSGSATDIDAEVATGAGGSAGLATAIVTDTATGVASSTGSAVDASAGASTPPPTAEVGPPRSVFFERDLEWIGTPKSSVWGPILTHESLIPKAPRAPRPAPPVVRVAVAEASSSSHGAAAATVIRYAYAAGVAARSFGLAAVLAVSSGAAVSRFDGTAIGTTSGDTWAGMHREFEARLDAMRADFERKLTAFRTDSAAALQATERRIAQTRDAPPANPKAVQTKRHVGILKAAGLAARRTRMPRQIWPKSIEMEYGKAMIGLLDRARPALAPLLHELPDMVARAAADRRGDRMDAGDPERARRLIDAARAHLEQSVQPTDVEALARTFGARTQTYQRGQLGRQVHAALGVDVYSRGRASRCDAARSFRARERGAHQGGARATVIDEIENASRRRSRTARVERGSRRRDRVSVSTSARVARE
jgi:hypothetical protein